MVYKGVRGKDGGNVAGDEVVIVALSNIQFLLVFINAFVNPAFCGPQAGGVSKAQSVKSVALVWRLGERWKEERYLGIVEDSR